MASTIILESFEIQRKMLTFMGYWHKKQTSKMYVLRGVIAMVIFFIAYIGMMMQNFVVDFKELSEGLYLFTSYTSYFLKLTGFLMGRKPFLKMMDMLKSPIFASHPKKVEGHLIKITKLIVAITKIYMTICFMCVLGSASVFFVDGTLPMPVPFDFGKYTFVAYIVEMTAMFIAVWNNLCLDTLCASLMALAVGQLGVLKYKIIFSLETTLEKLGTNNMLKNLDVYYEKIYQNRRGECLEGVQDDVLKTLANCAEHHSAIIEYVKLIEKVFSFSVFIQLMGSVVVICNTGFFMLIVTPFSAKFFMLIVYFITMLSQLSLYCWFGNEIRLKSLEIGEACYFSKWYMCNNKVKKLLFIVMERSKRPLEITALKFANLSLDTFSTIIRSSYSYFALLQRLASKLDLL